MVVGEIEEKVWFVLFLSSTEQIGGDCFACTR